MDRRQGMVFLELLAALAVAALVSLAGMRMLFLFMEEIEREAAADLEQMTLSQLESLLCRAIEERCAHRFMEGAWLEIKGLRRNGLIDIESFTLRSYAADGGIRRLELGRAGEDWQLVIAADVPESGHEAALHFDYNGRILLRAPGTKWHGGECPESLEFSFPEARSRALRKGFNIRPH